MSGTSPGDDLAARADHEAGHYVAARALNLDCRPAWVTIEEREGSGGRCSLIPKGENLVSHWLQWLLAGIVTESVGTLVRRYGTTIPTESVLDAESERVFRQAITEGGSADVDRAVALVTQYSSEHEYDLAAEFGKVKALLFQPPWRLEWLWISLHLQRDRTLYGGEANLILAARENDELKNFYYLYRRCKRTERAPREWFEGASPRYPAGPWYENITTFLARAAQRDGETEEQRNARLDIDMNT